jgi:glycogen debranching enzyme
VTVKITVGPPVLALNSGSTVMVTDHGGEVDPREAQGVFADDTRFVSRYELRVNGQSWLRVSSAPVAHHTAQLYFINPVLRAYGEEEVAEGAVALTLTRTVDDGIHEAFEITNYARAPVRIVLELLIMSDFADLFEVKAGQVRPRDHLITEWHPRRAELVTTYRRDDFVRRFVYKVAAADTPASYANGRLRFPLLLDAGASWQACGHLLLQSGQIIRKPLGGCLQPGTESSRSDRLLAQWVQTCTTLQTPHEDLANTYRQSVEDMGALRLHERDLGPDVWVPAAGVPWFVTLFGRDSLIAALQNLTVHARFAEGALRALAACQATARDDWRDAQPGKIVHEVRRGELAHFDVLPHTRYYGTWDATPLYLMLLHQAWRWLGDRRLIAQLLPAAERCLAWIDTDGDADGDGFQEYQTFSPKGYENMGWKDAADAVVYPDGSQVRQPKALCELQAYVYAAKCGMAEIYAGLGNQVRARALTDQAAALKRRFNEAFWWEEEGTYAYGLDADKHQIRTVASNAGHCLWAGIADADKAARVAQRLLAPDMWTGWGIRTLSAQNPAYDPFAYQRGSVWPHDNAIIAAGLARYGLHAAAHQVAHGLLDAAVRFDCYRLPEVFAGLTRAPNSFPVQYRGANIPQAWAAGAVFQLVQAMLGLDADLPNHRLYVDPCLPDWLPSLRLRGLQIGPVRLDLSVWRDDERSHFLVEFQQGGNLELCAGPAPSPDRSAPASLGPIA